MKNLKAIILDAVDSGLNAFAQLDGGPATAQALLDEASTFSPKQHELASRLMYAFELNNAAGMLAIFGLAYGLDTGVEEVVEEICGGLTDNEISKVFKCWVIYAMACILVKLREGSNPIAKDLSSSEFWRN